MRGIERGSKYPNIRYITVRLGDHWRRYPRWLHLAARLIGQAGVSQEGIRIIDPGPKLLHSWYRCSQNTGMRFLRSPSVHHLDVDPFSCDCLRNRSVDAIAKVPFTPPYDRPSVQLFSAHCDHVISKFQLQSIHVQDKVVDVDLRCDGHVLS